MTAWFCPRPRFSWPPACGQYGIRGGILVHFDKEIAQTPGAGPFKRYPRFRTLRMNERRKPINKTSNAFRCRKSVKSKILNDARSPMKYFHWNMTKFLATEKRRQHVLIANHVHAARIPCFCLLF